MDDDAEVLRFLRGAGSGRTGAARDDGRLGAGNDGYPSDGYASDGYASDGYPSDGYGLDEGRRYGGWSPSRATHELTEVVVIGDRVVDVVRRPVSGSGYECAALEIEDERRRPRVPPAPEPPGHEKQLDWLARIVGGADELTSLSTDELPPEDLDVGAVPAHLRERAAALDTRLAEAAPALIGPEGLTACRRLFVAAVAREPGVLTRSTRDDIAAAAVVWAVGRGNDLVGASRAVRSTAVSDAFGIRSSPGRRGEAFARAAGGGGMPPWSYPRLEPDVVPLGDPALLLGRFRRRVVALRDLALALRAATPVA